VHLPAVVHTREHLGTHQAHEWDDRPQGGAGREKLMDNRSLMLVSRPPIFADGVLAPLVTSLVMSKTFSESLEVIRV
jgi:hypothetical protein